MKHLLSNIFAAIDRKESFPGLQVGVSDFPPLLPLFYHPCCELCPSMLLTFRLSCITICFCKHLLCTKSHTAMWCDAVNLTNSKNHRSDVNIGMWKHWVCGFLTCWSLCNFSDRAPTVVEQQHNCWNKECLEISRCSQGESMEEKTL